MGFWSDFKAKRKYKNELREYNYKHDEWREDAEIFQKCLNALNLLAKGKDAAPDSLMRKPGELTIWSGTGRIRIPARTPSRYVGGSSGVSVPIVKGVRFRVGATRGSLVRGEEFLADAEVGDVVLTNQRLVFNGGMNSMTWLFDKWNGASTDPTSTQFVFNVSNSKKASGLTFDKSVGKEFNRFLSVALKVYEDGLPEMIEGMKDLIKEKNAEEPKPPAQILPSKQVKAIGY